MDYLSEKLEKDSASDDVQVEAIRPYKRSSMEFNGVQVSLPQYYRLMELQEKVLQLDGVMRKLTEDVSPDKLASSQKWNQLVSMRQSLQKLLPQEHPIFNKRSMEFNGVQVRIFFWALCRVPHLGFSFLKAEAGLHSLKYLVCSSTKITKKCTILNFSFEMLEAVQAIL